MSKSKPKIVKTTLVEFQLKEVVHEDGIRMMVRPIIRLNGELGKSKAKLIMEAMDIELKKN